MSPETWESFFLGQLGATAALGGLLFVAISINVAKIVEIAGLADRAVLSLLILLAVLTVAALMLMPGQSPFAMGLEVVVVLLIAMAGGTVLGLRGIRSTEAAHRGNAVVGLVGFELACLIGLVGGVLLVAGAVAGLYWLAVGMCIGVAKAVTDAWVFLVEINR
jgi:hypothetical protein